MGDSRIKVIIDVVGDRASTSLRNFRTELKNAEGAFGKMKVAGSGAFEAIKANAANMAVAAGAALVAFGAKAVSAFQDLALEAGKFSEATGIAVEDASRWIEVAGDVGVSTETIQGAFQRMNKAIADGKLDEFSAQIVRAKDGTVDASATFQNLVTTIGAIKDPTERAQAAQDAFGRSYGEMAELMEMDAKSLQQALADVSDEKVIDEGEVKKARDFRAAMDKLNDAAQDLTLKIGGSLVPVLTDAADAMGAISDGVDAGWLGTAADQVVTTDNLVEGLSEALDGNRTGWQRLGGAVSLVTGVFPVLGEQTQKLGGETLGLEEAALAAVDALGLEKGATDESAAATAEAAAAIEAEKAAVEASIAAHEERAALLEEQANAQRAAADSGFAVRDAEDSFVESLAAANEVLASNEGDLRAVRGALDDTAEAAGGLADATVRQYEEQAKANGVTLSAKQSQDIWNSSMLNSAASASGPLRQSIIAYIAQVNGIPPEKVSEIQAAIDNGSVDWANAVLADASKTRDALVVAEAETAQAENELAYLTRTRNATINAQIIARSGAGYGGRTGDPEAGGAEGAIVTRPTRAWIGEAGPEALIPLDQMPGAFPLPNGGSAAGGNVTTNVTINMPPGSNGEDVVRAIRRYERTNGASWRS